jgi:hypothetical protein
MSWFGGAWGRAFSVLETNGGAARRGESLRATIPRRLRPIHCCAFGTAEACPLSSSGVCRRAVLHLYAPRWIAGDGSWFLQGLKPLFRNWIQTGLLSEPSAVSPCCSGGRGVCFLLWGEPGRLRGKWFFRANQESRAPSRRDSFKARFRSKRDSLRRDSFKARLASRRDSCFFRGSSPCSEIGFRRDF